MAGIVNADYATFIGTAEQLQKLFERLTAGGAAVLNAAYANFVVLDKELDREKLAQAMRTTPERQKQ